MSDRRRALIQPPHEPTAAERLQAAPLPAEGGLDVQRARVRREFPTCGAEQVEETPWAWVFDRPPSGSGCPGLREPMHRFERRRAEGALRALDDTGGARGRGHLADLVHWAARATEESP